MDGHLSIQRIRQANRKVTFCLQIYQIYQSVGTDFYQFILDWNLFQLKFAIKSSFYWFVDFLGAHPFPQSNLSFEKAFFRFWIKIYHFYYLTLTVSRKIVFSFDLSNRENKIFSNADFPEVIVFRKTQSDDLSRIHLTPKYSDD